MGRKEIKRQLKVKCKAMEYKIIRIANVPDSDSMFALLFDGIDVSELYVNPYIRYASLQTLSSISIHESRDISHWFDFD